EPYAQWIAVGQALHSTEAPEAFEIWDTWSRGAANYDGSTATKWRTFNAGGPLHVESIFVWARDAGWDGTAPQVAVPVESIRHYVASVVITLDTSSQQLQITGALESFVDLCNRTAT